MRIGVVVAALAIPVFALSASADRGVPAGEKLFSLDPPSSAEGASESWPLKDGRGMKQLGESARESAERAEKFEQRLEAPESRSEREVSKTAHLGATDVVASRLVEQEFGELLAAKGPDGGVEAVAKGREVARFLSDHVMVLAGTDDRPPVLVDSPMQLRAVDEAGRKAAVDLTLTRNGDDFVPANSVADVVVPSSLAEGVRVGRVGVVPDGAAEGQIVGGETESVVYPNAQLDTDVVVGPRALGVEVFWQLRSPRASEELLLGLELPNGAVAQQTKIGSVVVTEDGKPLTTISSPTAVDAQGREVPVDMEIRGDRLALSIEHRQADVAYPVLVDPVIDEVYANPETGAWWLYQDAYALSRLGEWDLGYGGGAAYGQYIQRHHCYAPVSCDSSWYNPNWHYGLLDIPDGLHIYGQHNPISYPAGSYAQFVYEPALGTTTQVESVDMMAFYHRRGGSQNPTMFTGIYSASAAWVSIRHETMDLDEVWIEHDANTSAPGRRSAVFGMYSATNVMNGPWRDGYIGGVALGLTDPEAPTVSGGQMRRMSVPEDGSEGAWEDRNNATRWVKPQDKLAIRPFANDPGLGVREVWVEDGDSESNHVHVSGCIGNKASRCPGNWPPSGSDGLAAFSVKNMADGPGNVTVYAKDPVSHQSAPYTFPVKVDATPPVINENNISGSLWAAKEQPNVAPENQQILSSGSHNISFTATDMGVGVTASGVERIEVRVDGQVASPDTAVTCSAGNCQRSISWNYNTAEFGGRHKIELYAEDGAGNVQRKVFYVNAAATGSLVYPADNEITSSKIALQGKDNDDDFTGVKFQYRKRPVGSWTTINSHVTDDQGAPVSGDTHTLTEPGRHSKKLIWDARTAMNALVPKATQIQVRAVFAGGGPEFNSQVANVDIDYKGISAENAQQEIGPGSVDLLSGNFTYSATDAALSTFAGPIEVRRTFNSLDPDATGPFGPGWVVSAPMGGVSDYSSLVVLTEQMMAGWVDLFDSAGKRIRFEKTGDTTFKVQTGFEGLTLERVPTSGQPDKYLLKDLDGVETTFITLPATSKFVPSKVKQPDEQGTASYNYEAYLGEPRLKRVVGPSPPNTNCDHPGVAATSLPLGCRVLEFAYMHFPSFGEERLRTVKQVASNGTTMVSDDIAAFRYRAYGEHIGRLVHAYDPRITPELTEVYEYTGASHRLGTITPPGEAPWSLSYMTTGTHIDKLSSVSRTADDSGLESWRMAWGVPLSTTAGGPYEMTATALAVWGQEDRPIDATAILPPTEAGSGYAKASISYLNQDGRVVNSAAPGGRIAVAEHDPKGNVVRELSAANRARATLYPGNTQAKADYSRTIDTQRTYAASGLRVTDEVGPQHDVKLDSGQVVAARAHTHTTYDEGYTPQGNQPPQLHLPTTTATGALVNGTGPDVDVRVVKTDYNWTLRKPTKTTVDAVSGGLNIENETQYNAAGLETASWQPKSNGSDAGTLRTAYFTHDDSSSFNACDNKPHWHNLPCGTYYAAQPATPGLPNLPITQYTYDRYGNVLTATETIGGTNTVTRTTTTTYDPAGRKLTESLATDDGGSGGGEDPEDPAGLVAAYGFNEGSGNTASDSSENGLDGTVSGASWTSSGKYGGALSFDGTDDSVSVPDANALDLTTAMTLSAWVKMDAVSNRVQALLYKERNGNDGSYALEADSTVSSRPGLNFRTTGWQAARAPDPLSTGQWAHLAATWDGTTTKVYLNGTLVKTQSMTGTVTTSTGLLKIGGTAITGSNQHVDGLIDEVRIYNRGLSEVEVQADKNTSVATQLEGAPPPSTLVAAYGFDEGSGGTVVDSSGYANDGTISGASWTGSGKYGSALSFDGTDDSVSIPDSDSLDLTSALTLSAWVKPDATYNRYQNVIVKERNGNDGSYVLAGDSTTSSRPGLEIRKSGGWESARAPDPLAAGQWSHLAATWDGSTAKVYLNGALVKTQNMTGTIVDSSGLLRIGGTAVFGNNRHVDGLIDEVRIYSRALSQTEILADKDTSVADQIAALNPPSMGDPIPTVTYGYSSTTGRPATVSTPVATTTTVYDNVGRATSYTDANGTHSTTTYDKLNRPVTTNDGKGTQTNTFDGTTGLLTSVMDTHNGTPQQGFPSLQFTATYDADGRIVSKTYPNGMKADTTYDPSGSPVALKYTKTSNCLSDCVWIDEQVKESIHGQWRTHSWELSSQEYTYDQAGRLTTVIDDVHSPAAVEGCTIRAYAFDTNSNRTSMNTKAPAGNGDCQLGAAGATKTYTYDDADRLTGTGIQYDRFGRVIRVPSHHSGGGVLTYTYYANDQARTLAQDGVSKTYALDPMGRQRQTVATGGTTYTETFNYRGGSDSPSWTSVANAQGVEASWERNIQGIDGDLAAIRTHNAQGDVTVLQLQNLHGDIIATTSSDPNATAPSARFESDEFGNPRQQSGRRYGWLGGKQRRAELASGVVQMGVRSYIPALGRFSSVDPVAGGSATAYDYAGADPVNNLDLDGRRCVKGSWTHTNILGIDVPTGVKATVCGKTTKRLKGILNDPSFKTVEAIADAVCKLIPRLIPGYVDDIAAGVTCAYVVARTVGPLRNTLNTMGKNDCLFAEWSFRQLAHLPPRVLPHWGREKAGTKKCRRR